MIKFNFLLNKKVLYWVSVALVTYILFLVIKNMFKKNKKEGFQTEDTDSTIIDELRTISNNLNAVVDKLEFEVRVDQAVDKKTTPTEIPDDDVEPGTEQKNDIEAELEKGLEEIDEAIAETEEEPEVESFMNYNPTLNSYYKY